ncbi:MAG TPA: heme-binding domain-containing protein [Kofleriaceae bacterium]|nr:heme-binding domain-containing protein [Kofleriaceae bacterium]
MARPRWKRILGIAALALAGALVVAQLVPYGRDHSNPPVATEPHWDSPATRLLAQRACFDCHSNETHWPWYSHVAPSSWLLQNHVDEGREVLNFSEFQKTYKEADEAGKEVREGEMPPFSYLLLHPEARLSADEKQQLARGLDATLGAPHARR